MGIFSSERNAASAIDRLRETPWTIERVPQPYPQPPPSRMPWNRPRAAWVGLPWLGVLSGSSPDFLLAAFTATRWSLIVSGKPVVALVPFFIVGFEFTILFAVLGNVLGLISQARLPRFDTQAGYDERFSGDHFGVLACCRADEQDELTRFFKDNGGEVKEVKTDDV